MTQDAIQLLTGFFSLIWNFFRSLIVPGTNVSVAQLFFFLLFVFLITKYIKKIVTNSGSDKVGRADKNE